MIITRVDFTVYSSQVKEEDKYYVKTKQKKICKACVKLLCLLTCVTNVFQQEKLSKDIDYLIGKESQVKSQISELNLLMKETEVSDKLVCIFFIYSSRELFFHL